METLATPAPNSPCEVIQRDDGSRWYVTPAGVLPSVTTVLAQTADDTWLRCWKARVGEAEALRRRTEAAARGTALHAMVEAYYRHGIEGSGPWWDSLVPLLGDIEDVQCIETPVHHAVDGYAGTVDLVARYQGELCVIDWKTSGKPKRRSDRQVIEYAMQVAAYSAAYRWTFCERITSALVVVSLEGPPCQVFRLEPDAVELALRGFEERLDAFYAVCG